MTISSPSDDLVRLAPGAQRVGSVEAAAANGRPLTDGCFHSTAFVRGLLLVGLPHAALNWGDAAPFGELVRTLVLLPAPVGGALAPAWRMHGGLSSLAAYVIGECAIEMPEHLGEPLMGFPRPQRGASPPRTTSVMSNNEGGAAIIEAIAVLLEQANSPQPAGEKAHSPPDGGGAGGGAAEGGGDGADGPDGRDGRDGREGADGADGAISAAEGSSAAPADDEDASGRVRWHERSNMIMAADRAATAAPPRQTVHASAVAIPTVVHAPEGAAAAAAAVAVSAVAVGDDDESLGSSVVEATAVSLGARPAVAGAASTASASFASASVAAELVVTPTDPLSNPPGDAEAPPSAAPCATPPSAAPSSAAPPSAAPKVPAAPDLIASAAYVNSALKVSLRAGGEGVEAVLRALELCCHGSADRSAPVLQASLAAMRSEAEALALSHSQVLVRLLTKVDDDLTPLRCSMALKAPHGLLGLLRELISANPPDAAAHRAELEAERQAAAAAHGAQERGGWSEAHRCFLCIRVLLELHASGGAVAGWLEDVLGAEVADVMSWLKETSRTAALGRPAERARFLGVPRMSNKPRYERSDEQQAALDQLKALEKRGKSSKRTAR